MLTPGRKKMIVNRKPSNEIIIKLDDSLMPAAIPLPAIGKYSMGPDMKFGWKPKDLDSALFPKKDRIIIEEHPAQLSIHNTPKKKSPRKSSIKRQIKKLKNAVKKKNDTVKLPYEEL